MTRGYLTMALSFERGEESDRWRTGIVLVSIHNHFAFEIELHIIGEHLCMDGERDVAPPG